MKEKRVTLRPNDRVRVARFDKTGLVRVDPEKGDGVIKVGLGQWEVPFDEVSYPPAMGVQSNFSFPSGNIPSWEQPRLARRAIAIRMIDGMPAFPDEAPTDGWNEVRIGLAGTMITLRRTAEMIAIVTWGTVDPALEAARNRGLLRFFARRLPT